VSWSATDAHDDEKPHQEKQSLYSYDPCCSLSLRTFGVLWNHQYYHCLVWY
jgi:hypothetical protein